jgi:Fur family transcriptional regulator, ferric uptake regulator
MCCQQEFLKQLRERGFRLTPQREMVLDILHDVSGHVTAEEVYDRVSRLSSCVDISTVYRTLELLQDFHLVGVVEIDGQRRYELLGLHGPHFHLRCNACNQLVRIEPNEIQPLIEQMQQRHGFQIAAGDLILDGVCRECQTNQSGGTA